MTLPYRFCAAKRPPEIPGGATSERPPLRSLFIDERVRFLAWMRRRAATWFPIAKEPIHVVYDLDAVVCALAFAVGATTMIQ